MRGRMRTPREPYTFIHNTGCSECQEGFGAVTPYTRTSPWATNVALMIDVAFLGFDEKKRLVFPVEYAVIEDGFWKSGTRGRRFQSNAARRPGLDRAGDGRNPRGIVNPYHRPFPVSARRWKKETKRGRSAF